MLQSQSLPNIFFYFILCSHLGQITLKKEIFNVSEAFVVKKRLNTALSVCKSLMWNRQKPAQQQVNGHVVTALQQFDMSQ